jgi:subtilisin family serine protease
MFEQKSHYRLMAVLVLSALIYSILPTTTVVADVNNGIAPGQSAPASVSPEKKDESVQWNDNKIVSRVLPYPDFISLFIRLPIAHAAATGQGVKVAVIGLAPDQGVSSLIMKVAPGAELKNYIFEIGENKDVDLAQKIGNDGCRVAVIPDVQLWNGQTVIQLTGQLLDNKIIVVLPSDLSEDSAGIDVINTLHSIGALTIGRVSLQSLVMEQTDGSKKPFNIHIRKIQTDLFSTVEPGSSTSPTNPVAAAAGVAALVLEKWPGLTAAEVRAKMIAGARNVWQTTSIETGQWQGVNVDPITTKYTPDDENAIFRFRVLDAAGSLQVDTEIPWYLNMLNCQKAWEINKGRGVVVLVTDNGFNIRHPELKDKIKATMHFGPWTFDNPEQNFHGTDMSRILLSIAPDTEIIPVLCSGWDSGNDVWAQNIAKSFIYAVEQKVDVVASSWGFWCKDYENILSAVRNAVDNGIVVSWFHYPQEYPGLLRSSLTYSNWTKEPCLGFADRFLTDPPGFHPVEVEAGLSGTAPQAAGIAALAKSVNPRLTPQEIEALIFENSTPIGNNILIPDAYKIVLAARDKK